MDKQTEKTGLGFFGAVTASISHEIKNRIAIINEQAGLLEDLVLMAERGGQLNFETLKRVSNSVKNQVKKGDSIIRNMNRFAHTADTPSSTIELGSIIQLTAELASRGARLKSVKLTVDSGCPQIELTTAPFLLINLVWFGIETILEGAAQGAVLHLRWETEPESVVVRIYAEPAAEAGAVDSVPEDAERLCAALDAVVQPDPGNGSWAIRLPKNAAGRRPADPANGA
jgi:C4-dicarboxylate-specific signal transduction histidine kinase